MAKNNEIIVKEVAVKTIKHGNVDYICMTDIARMKNAIDPNGVIANWMRNRNTIEFLGIWETLYNPNFNPLEFEGIRAEAGLNAFTMSPTRWVELTNAIGIISQAGRYGGTYACSDIAFEFASWVSVEFRLYLVKEFQRLKEVEQKHSAGRQNASWLRSTTIYTPTLSRRISFRRRLMPTIALSYTQRRPMC